MSSKIEVPRELLERHLLKFSMAGLLFTNVEGLLKSYDELNEILAAPVVERQPSLYRVLTPRVTVGSEITEWFPDFMLYNQAQLASIVGPYEITERFYTDPPELTELQATIDLQDQLLEEKIVEK